MMPGSLRRVLAGIAVQETCLSEALLAERGRAGHPLPQDVCQLCPFLLSMGCTWPCIACRFCHL